MALERFPVSPDPQKVSPSKKAAEKVKGVKKDVERGLKRMRQELSDDMYYHVGREEGQMSPDEFLRKHQKLLKTDLGAFSIAAMASPEIVQYSSDHDYFLKLAKLGRRLIPEDPITIKFMLDGIRLQGAEDAEVEKLLRIFFRLYEKNPARIGFLLSEEAVNFPKIEAALDKKADKPLTLGDENFSWLVQKAIGMGSTERQAEFALNLLLHSKEVSFQDQAIFDRVVWRVIDRYNRHQSDDLVRMVLRRGGTLVNEDVIRGDMEKNGVPMELLNNL
jgi:hypothetical protein